MAWLYEGSSRVPNRESAFAHKQLFGVIWLLLNMFWAWGDERHVKFSFGLGSLFVVLRQWFLRDPDRSGIGAEILGASWSMTLGEKHCVSSSLLMFVFTRTPLVHVDLFTRTPHLFTCTALVYPHEQILPVHF